MRAFMSSKQAALAGATRSGATRAIDEARLVLGVTERALPHCGVYGYINAQPGVGARRDTMGAYLALAEALAQAIDGGVFDIPGALHWYAPTGTWSWPGDASSAAHPATCPDCRRS